ncbi:hypothetical protein DPX16_0511 [Anabarilius grahami]|uniref:Uncharacterized protein n=1 Tax=Anabarilius grahami TaxID=495550 RepID=A0A3N0XMA5_ANAGA|nr:hypothetical protein DPX16_0511 [Anabarilius grahami]
MHIKPPYSTRGLLKAYSTEVGRGRWWVVTLSQWCQEKVNISLQGGETRVSTITVKKETPIQEDELVKQFQDRLFNFRRHIFNIRWQYKEYRNLRESLTAKDCLIHIDFSENYSCKYSNEIQSVHFGGSHQQVTLHTGVLYLVNQPPMPFCTISPSRRHDPPAIWAHLDPILDFLKKDHSDVQNLHFFSDGPVTQYKNRSNFYIISTEPHQKGFSTVTWSYFEAGHGKGSPDGVGAALKRTADNLVRQGKDIPDAQSFFQLLKDTSKVKLYYVSEKEVEKKDEDLRQVPLFALKGTMKMHEVLSISPGILKYRDISCFCQAAEGVFDCPCHSLEEVTLVAMDAINQTGKDFRPNVIEQHHSGQWCVVQYDDDPYPGIILQVEENHVKVKCMHRNGVNKFFWPSPRDDVNCYGDDQIICLIQEPLALNKRSVQLDRPFWEFIMGQLGK